MTVAAVAVAVEVAATAVAVALAVAIVKTVATKPAEAETVETMAAEPAVLVSNCLHSMKRCL